VARWYADNADRASTVVEVFQSGVSLDGGNVSTTVSVTVYEATSVAAGDTIDFTVGNDGTYSYDSTGLDGTLSCLYGMTTPTRLWPRVQRSKDHQAGLEAHSTFAAHWAIAAPTSISGHASPSVSRMYDPPVSAATAW
jgi:hypothetical protein